MARGWFPLVFWLGAVGVTVALWMSLDGFYRLPAAGDALLIAGKGHESGQIMGDVVYPFDDVEQASLAIAALQGRV